MTLSRTIPCALLIAAVTCNLKPAVADDEDQNPHVLRAKTTSVSVFKNGLGFFLREGTAVKRDGWVMAERIPPAKFGTLAVFSQDEQETIDVVSSGPSEIVDFDGVDAPDTDQARRNRLQQSLQLKAQITYEEEDAERKAVGSVESVGPRFAILDSGQHRIAVPIAAISRLEILELPLRIHVAGPAVGNDDDAQIGIAYLSGGITWIPEYSVKILDGDTAELTLRGTLINQAEDLVHCDVNFIVGVPHFAHSDYLAPLAVGQVIRAIGTAVAPPQLRRQIMNRAAIVSNDQRADQFQSPQIVEQSVADRGGDLAQALGNLPQLDAPGSGDYTVYTKKDLTLRRGEKAIVALFTRKIRYSHIYRWSPPQRMEHFLRLQNDTSTAWTTGPYLALSDGQPLSEDLIKYTPKGGFCEIPVTAAINIAHDHTEVEIDRKLKAHSPSHNFYVDLITLSGTLTLRNFEPNDVHIVITAPVKGKPTEASDDGRLEADPTKLKLLERAGKITWTLTLPTGKDKKLTYKYQRYVPSK